MAFKIQFINKKTGEVINGDNWLFVMNDKVYQDNFESCESQSSVVGFDTFIEERPDLEWEVVK